MLSAPAAAPGFTDLFGTRRKFFFIEA